MSDATMEKSSLTQTNPYPKLQERGFTLLASALGTIVALLPSNPNNMSLPSRDSGVFLYVGWRLISGDVPYKDVWDHKPPLIYFVDALGITLTPHSLWGVWLLQAIFVFLTFYLLYSVLDQVFGRLAAWAAIITFASGLLTILERGNVTEQYALLFQALGLWLMIKASKDNYPIRTSFWIGLCAGLAFNFKQTTIGIWIAYAILLLVARLLQRKSPLMDWLSLLLGWLIPSLIIVAYFASRNALFDFWDQAFLYNFTYIGKHEGIRRLIPVFAKGFFYLTNGGVLYLAILGWLAGLGYFWLKRKNFTEVNPLIPIALMGLPVEVILITISGRSILHYYLTPLPIMAALTGILIYTLPFLAQKIIPAFSQKVYRWMPAMLVIAIILPQYGQVTYYPKYMHALSGDDYAPVIQYISENTEANDKVLIIGAESVVNFLAQREAPTRYVYQYPLALLGRRPMFEEYFNQILQNKPILIIDTRGRNSLTDKLYESMQKRSPLVREGVKYLGENYQQVAQFGEWRVYRFTEKP